MLIFLNYNLSVYAEPYLMQKMTLIFQMYKIRCVFAHI